MLCWQGEKSCNIWSCQSNRPDSCRGCTINICSCEAESDTSSLIVIAAIVRGAWHREAGAKILLVSDWSPSTSHYLLGAILRMTGATEN